MEYNKLIKTITSKLKKINKKKKEREFYLTLF